MHAPTLAVAEHLAVATLALFHPLAVAIRFEAILPHIPEILLVDVALVVLATDAGACRNIAIKGINFSF